MASMKQIVNRINELGKLSNKEKQVLEYILDLVSLSIDCKDINKLASLYRVADNYLTSLELSSIYKYM